MHPARLLVILAVAVLGGCAHSGRKGELLVYLLAGQSNGDGRPLSSGLPTTPVNLRMPQDDIPFYYNSHRRNPSVYTTLRPGSPGDPAPAGKAFGPEIAFGRTLANWLALHRPSDRIAIIKYAKGGSSLHTDWKAGGTGTPENDGPCYVIFQNTVTAGLAALKADPALKDLTPRIAGLIWVQGESDTDGTPYAENLTTFISDIRSTYGDIPVHLSALSVNQIVFSHGSPGVIAAFESVRKAQHTVATTLPATYCIETDTPAFSVAPDKVHFDVAGQLALGKALAQSVIATLGE